VQWNDSITRNYTSAQVFVSLGILMYGVDIRMTIAALLDKFTGKIFIRTSAMVWQDFQVNIRMINYVFPHVVQYSYHTVVCNNFQCAILFFSILYQKFAASCFGCQKEIYRCIHGKRILCPQCIIICHHKKIICFSWKYDSMICITLCSTCWVGNWLLRICVLYIYQV
jgi:hypothetical protein